MDAIEGNLRYSLESLPGCAVLRLSGDLDACTAAELEVLLGPSLQNEEERLVADLRDLEFIDSTGIRLLLTLVHGRTRDAVTLVRPRRGVARRALELVGLERIIPAVDDLSDALRRSPGTVEPGAGAF